MARACAGPRRRGEFRAFGETWDLLVPLMHLGKRSRFNLGKAAS